MDEAPPRVTGARLIHNDGFGVQMPFSALSLSWETDCPLPSLLFSVILCLWWGSCVLIIWGTLAVLCWSLTSACYSVFRGDAFHCDLHQLSGRAAALESKCLQAIQSLNVYIYWDESFNIVQWVYSVKFNELRWIVVPCWLYCGYNTSSMSTIIVCSCYCNMWDLMPCREYKISLYTLVYVAGRALLSSIKASDS